MIKEEEVENYRNGSAHVNGKEEDVNSSEYAVPAIDKSDLLTCRSQQAEVDGEGDGDGTNNQYRGTEAAENTEAMTMPISISTKGYGLKKWKRRIRRRDQITSVTETEKDKDSDSDSNSNSTVRMLKRGSANILNENDNHGSSSSPLILPSHATPISSALVNSLSAAADSDATPTFNVGADGQRSSSTSSTKAQGHHHHLHSRDKIVSAKNVRVGKPQPQPHLDPTKKARGGSLDEEKESSPLSSLESDSRSSSNSVFIRPSRQIPIPAPTPTPTPVPLSLGGEDILLPPSPSQHPSSQQRPATPTHSLDQLSSSANQGTSCDPLVDSILMLQAAQLALQTELQNFGEIGEGICSLYDDSDKTSGVAFHSMSVDPVAYMDRASMCGGWNEIVQTLERQLNEAEVNLKEKELRIAELETTLRSMESPQDCVRSVMEQQYKRCIEMEAELQDLFKQKLEAEVQSVVITKSTKDFSVLVNTKYVPGEDAQSPRAMVDIENKVGLVEKSDTLYTGEEILKMQRGVVKFTKCLVMQLVLLVFVFALFVLQLVPKSAVVVPT